MKTRFGPFLGKLRAAQVAHPQHLVHDPNRLSLSVTACHRVDPQGWCLDDAQLAELRKVKDQFASSTSSYLSSTEQAHMRTYLTYIEPPPASLAAAPGTAASPGSRRT